MLTNMAGVEAGDTVTAGDTKDSEVTTSKPSFVLRPSAFSLRSETSNTGAASSGSNLGLFVPKSAQEPNTEMNSDTSSATCNRFVLRPSSLDKHASVLSKDSSLSSPFRTGSVGFKLEPAKLCSPLSSKFADNNKTGMDKADGVATSTSLPTTASAGLFTVSSTTSTLSGSYLFGHKIDSPDENEQSNSQAPLIESSSTVSSVTSSDASASASSFVFGSNLAERVIVAAPGSTTEIGSHLQTGGGEADTPRAEQSPSQAEGTSDMPTVQSTAHSLVESAALQSAAKQSHVELKEVEVVTGEEGESNVFQLNVKLFVFETKTQNWIEKGIGLLRLNDRKTESGAFQSRLVMRIAGSMRVVLNSMIWPAMLVERASKKSVKISAVDPDDGQTIRIYLIQAHFSDTENIFSAINSRAQKLRSLEGAKKQSVAEKDSTLNTSQSDLSGEKRSHSADSESEKFQKRQRLDAATGEESTDSSAIDPETEASNEDGYASSPVVHSTSPSSEA